MNDYKSPQTMQAGNNHASSGNFSSGASTKAQRKTANRVVANNHYNYNSGDYARRRQSFYSGYSPAYYNRFYPRYGMWDTLALCYMLDHISDQQYAMMYYSHRNDPDMQAWRAKAEEEARTNADLRAKLAVMDSNMQAMQGQNVQANPDYVPPAMNEVALSQDALKDAEPKKSGHLVLYLLLCIGLGAFVYFVFLRKY